MFKRIFNLNLPAAVGTVVMAFFLGVAALQAASGSGSHLDKITNNSVPVQANLLTAHVNFLAGLNPPRNCDNLSSLDAAADYIASAFKDSGYTVDTQPYTIHGRVYRNLIASIGPKEAPRVIVGAHYDVCGDTPGADDNASGVAALLEIARLFRELKPDLGSRLDFVAYTLEEPPFYGTDLMGSAIHARSLAEANVPVKAVVVFEMLGYYSSQPASQSYPAFFLHWFYPNTGDFIALVSTWGNEPLIGEVKRHLQQNCAVPVHTLTGPGFINGLDFSDHRNYTPYQYQAIMVTDSSFYRNHHYHQSTDSADTLDMDKMTELVKGLYWTLVQVTHWERKGKFK